VEEVDSRKLKVESGKKRERERWVVVRIGMGDVEFKPGSPRRVRYPGIVWKAGDWGEVDV
jgi:hypothetical protein